MSRLWERLFLEERPSLMLSLFRIAVALTVGFHVIPTFYPLADTYFSTALRTVNPSFFPRPVIELVQQSSDGVVTVAVVIFLAVWLGFLVGLFTQVSVILMTLACYYFYALNALHIGTLSWDILLVTLVLMCVSPYPGDYFSVDALRRRDVNAYARRRPYFVQRLLQMQVAFNYFYTALYKITAEGNWLTDKPLYYLMNYPPEGVTKFFWGREFWAGHPEACYILGLVIVGCELAMPFLLFYPRTRVSGIYLGFIFHVALILTLDVPAIFFFLFPAQLLLFINPEKVLAWVEQKRTEHRQSPRPKLVYDGNCHFCKESLKTLQVMDLYETLDMVDYQNCDKMETIHSSLTRSLAHSQMHLVEPDGTLYGGFFVFRRLAFLLPLMYVLLPLFYFPGMGVIGPVVYRWVANNRYLFHNRKDCRNNACFIKPQDSHDSPS